MTQPSNETTPSPDMQKTLGSLIVVVYVIGALALIAYVGFFAFIQRARLSSDPGDWGTLGDYFGGLLNPVVSFATLVVAYAVWKQQKEELKATKEALEEQAKTAELQRKEQRFFDCLTLYQRLVDAQIVTGYSGSKSITEQGREALFSRARGALGTGEVGRLTSPAITRSLGRSADLPIPSLMEIRDMLPPDLRKRIGLSKSDAYCRGVLVTLQVAENVLGTSREKYLPLLTEQLTQEELSLLAMYLLFVPDGDQYWSTAEATGLFANLDTEGILHLSREYLPAACFQRSLEDN